MNASTPISHTMAASSSSSTPTSTKKRPREAEEENHEDLKKRVKALMQKSLFLERMETSALNSTKGLFLSLDFLAGQMDQMQPNPPQIALRAGQASPFLNWKNIPPPPPPASQPAKTDPQQPSALDLRVLEEMNNLRPEARLVLERINQWKAQIKKNCAAFIQAYSKRVEHSEGVFYPQNPQIYTQAQLTLETDIKQVSALQVASEIISENLRKSLMATMDIWKTLAAEMIEPFDPIVLYSQNSSFSINLPKQRKFEAKRFHSYQILIGKSEKRGYVPDKPMQAYFHLFYHKSNERDQHEITQLFQELYSSRPFTTKSCIVFRSKQLGPSGSPDHRYYIASLNYFFQKRSFRYDALLTSGHWHSQFYAPPFKLCQDPVRQQQLIAAPREMHINIQTALHGLREAAVYALASKDDQELTERLPKARTFAHQLTALVPQEQLLPEYQALVRIATYVMPGLNAFETQEASMQMLTFLRFRKQEPHPKIPVEIYLNLLANACGLHVPHIMSKILSECTTVSQLAMEMKKLYQKILQSHPEWADSLETDGRAAQ